MNYTLVWKLESGVRLSRFIDSYAMEDLIMSVLLMRTDVTSVFCVTSMH